VTLGRYALLACGIVGATLPLTMLAFGADADGRRAMGYGSVVALVNALAAHALVQWAVRRSPQVFLATVLFGMVGRMAAMLGLVVAGILALRLPRLPLAFTLLAYFVLFLVFEIGVLHRRASTAETRSR
jgi:hypothetical protein